MNGYNKTDQSILAYYCDHCGSKAQIFWYQHDTTQGFYACPKCDVPTVRTNPKFVRNPDYLKVAMNQSQFHEDHMTQPNPYLPPAGDPAYKALDILNYERLYPVEKMTTKPRYLILWSPVIDGHCKAVLVINEETGAAKCYFQ